MDKYCSMMVRVHKLEETNDTLKTRLERFVTQTTSSTANNASNTANNPSNNPSNTANNASNTASNTSNTANNASNNTPRRKLGRRSAARAQEALIPSCPAKMDSENTVPAGQGQGSLGKRGCGALAASDNSNTPFKAQEALLNTAKRIKATATTPKPGSRQEEEEFRPEGLPELVQRGEASPFIMRRTAVQRCSPRLAAARHTATAPSVTPQHKVLEPLSLQSPVGMATLSDSPGGKGLCVSPAPSGEERRGRRSLSTRKTPEQREKRKEAMMTSSRQEENCQVQ
ncbi:centromere protein F-like [Salvelinus alpinus]